MKARAIPRSALWLVVILAVALAVLVYLRRRPEPADFTLGGPLFHTPADQIDGLLLTRDGAQYRLDRQPSGRWALSGAVRDYLDQEAVGRLLRRLTQATGGRLLAGSEPEDRRYDFNGPGAMRLTLFATDGSTEKLVVGARNPVTGGWYGSGAGRPACFPVSDGLHEVLKAIPLSQRLDKLLPLTDPAAVDTVMIQRGEITDLLARRHGRWFLRQPTEGDPALGAPYLAYRRLYQDREREEDGVGWTLANDVLVGQLVYECSGLSAQRILPPGDAARLLVGLGEGDIWRRVRLLGQGINPDPGEGSADLLEISFLPAGNAQSQPVRRLNTVLLAEVEAANTLAEPLSHLVDMRAPGLPPRAGRFPARVPRGAPVAGGPPGCGGQRPARPHPAPGGGLLAAGPALHPGHGQGPPEAPRPGHPLPGGPGPHAHPEGLARRPERAGVEGKGTGDPGVLLPRGAPGAGSGQRARRAAGGLPGPGTPAGGLG